MNILENSIPRFHAEYQQNKVASFYFITKHATKELKIPYFEKFIQEILLEFPHERTSNFTRANGKAFRSSQKQIRSKDTTAKNKIL